MQDERDIKDTRTAQNTEMITSQKRSSTELLDGLNYPNDRLYRNKVNDEPKIEFSSKKVMNEVNKKNLNEDSDFDLDNYW